MATRRAQPRSTRRWCFQPSGLFVPYRSFRDTHLRHHNDANLTDPYDDPESWYLPLPEWNRAGSLRRRILNLNNTLAGRLVLGPALGLAGFWRSEWRQLKGGDSATWQAWALHLAGAAGAWLRGVGRCAGLAICGSRLPWHVGADDPHLH
jgi:fatty acid desaturase